MPVSTWLPWALRAAWLPLPVSAGAVLADALDPRSAAVRYTATALLWAGWSVVVLALVLPRPHGLTALRLAAPSAALATIVAALDVRESTTGAGTAAIVSATLVPLALAFLPETGSWMVNGSAYGYERRHLLRAPGALLLGPLQFAAAVALAGVVAGPFLLATRQWVSGALALAIGLPAAGVAIRALHSLTQRWVVLVPAGLVLKDHVVLVDPVLFPRASIEELGPALAGTDALDLTARAPGTPLELQLREAVPLILVQPGRRSGQPGRSARLLLMPTRPGAVLDDAGARRIAVS